MTGKRRAKGEGAVYYDEATGRWVGQLDLGRDAGGKRIRKKVTGATKSAVSARMRELRKSAAEGVDLAQRTPTVAQLLEEWLAKGCGKKAPSTMERTRRRVAQHLIPGVGSVRLDKLTVDHVEDWLRAEAAAGQARPTIRDYRADLRQALAWAQRRRYVAWNPAALAELPPAGTMKPSAPKRTYTEEQAAALVAKLEGDDRWGPYFTTLLFLGMRPGEAAGLPWSAIDPDAGVVRIEVALQRGDGGAPLDIGPTKTKNRRSVSMPEPVAAALLRQRRQQAADRLKAGAGWSTDERWRDLVFTTEIGTPWWSSAERRAFVRLCKAADVPALTPYELRHSAASLLAAAGVDWHEIADLLGHADLRMLTERYRHRTTPVVGAHVAAMNRIAGSTS